MKVFPEAREYGQVQPSVAFSQVTLFLMFRKENNRLKFNEFKKSLSSKYIYLVAYLVMSYYFGVTSASSYFYYPTALSAALLAFSLAIPIVIGFLVLLLHYKEVLYCNSLLNILSEYILQLESLWLLGCAISFGLIIVSMGQNGLCTNINAYGCNYSGVEGKMPEDIVFAAAVLPLCLSCAVKSASWLSILLTYFIGLFASLFTVIHYDLQIWWAATIMFEIGLLVVLYEQQRQSIQVFLLTESQSALLTQIEKMTEEVHAKELRSMIANVAHDLKTPITALVNGLEYILTIVGDMSRSNGTPTTGGFKDRHLEQYRENVQGILETANNMRHVNSFLLMSINRCLDYTKASNGVPLVPHHASARLLELLNGPINCMKNLQEVIRIDLLPIGGDIHSRIVTDKQWFQENLLCLLSNAVKFTSEGTVTVSVSLVKCREAKEAQFPSPTSGNRALLMSPNAQMLRIDVEDQGQGIRASDLQYLFSTCKQAQRSTGGTGLGLYSLSKRVEALGGCYGLLPRKDGHTGCNFWFSIPYRTEEAVRSELENEVMSGKSSRSDRSARAGRSSCTSPPMSLDLTGLSQFDTSGGLFTSFNKKILSRGSTQTSKALTRNSTGINDTEVVDNEEGTAANTRGPLLKPQPHSNRDTQELSATVRMRSTSTLEDVVGIAIPKSLPSSPLHGLTSSVPVSPLHVLLVDDAISILKITGNMLRKLGHTVVTAENGSVALKLLMPSGGLSDGVKFDVVLMDLQMPIMDGLEATRRLRAAEAAHNLREECCSVGSGVNHTTGGRPPPVSGRGQQYLGSGSIEELEVCDIENQQHSTSDANMQIAVSRYQHVHQKIIGISACSDEDTIQSAYAAGIDAFIAKPFNMTSFSEIYQTLLHGNNNNTISIH